MTTKPDHEIDVDSINLTDSAFWTRPLQDRQAAFAALRKHKPIAFFDEPDQPPIPKGPGTGRSHATPM